MRKLIIILVAMALNATTFACVSAAPFDESATPAPPVTANSATAAFPSNMQGASGVAATKPAVASELSALPETASTVYNPIVTLLPSLEHKGWKSTDRFDFSTIDGVLESYSANTLIEFTVAGTSSSLAVEKANGFNVVATLFDTTRKIGRRAGVAYAPDKHAWIVRLAAPSDNSATYKLIINLFCEKQSSLCADTFGFGTQIDKSITLQVR